MAKSSKSKLYKILGVKKNALPEEIKQAFRRKSNQLHPDRNPGDEKAAEQFKEVQHAYDVLGDPSRRKLYDETGEEIGTAPDLTFSRFASFLMTALEATFEDMVNNNRNAKTEDVIKVLVKRFESAMDKATKLLTKVTKIREEMEEAGKRFKGEDNPLAGLSKTLIDNYRKKEEGIRKELAMTLEVVKYVQQYEYDFVKMISGEPKFASWQFIRTY